MITKLCKGIRKREVITSPGVGPYTTNQKVTYWIESDKKGIMDSQWHEAAWERFTVQSHEKTYRPGKAVYGGRLAFYQAWKDLKDLHRKISEDD